MKKSAGFSLIEVILAIGIVGFGLLAIFSMVSGALNVNADTAAQHESLSVSRAIPDYLTEKGFDDVAADLSGGKIEGLYGYTVSTNGAPAQAVIAEAAKANSDADERKGKLFRLTFTLSPNVALRDAASGNYKVNPSVSDFTNSADPQAFLPLQVRMEVVPSTAAPSQSNNQATFTYDVVLSR